MKILLADDHGLFRDSMAEWLKKLDDNIRIDFAADWPSLDAQLSRSYNLILLDLNMPGLTGIAAVSAVLKKVRNTPVLVVSANQSASIIHACIQNGASGYITKAASGSEILSAIKCVLSGQVYTPEQLNKNTRELHDLLTSSQLQLLALLTEGMSNKEIARKMCLSEGTVKQYVSELLRVLNVDNRTQAGNKGREILALD